MRKLQGNQGRDTIIRASNNERCFFHFHKVTDRKRKENMTTEKMELKL